MPYFGYYNLTSSSLLSLNNFVSIVSLNGGTTGLCWDNTGNNVYVTIYTDGLYKINIGSKQITKLISFCDSKRYETISCSSNGKYLVAQRVDITVDHEQGKIFEKKKNILN